MSRPILRLHTDRLVSNIGVVRDRIAPSALMLVLKDDAYGHGLGWAVETAHSAGVEWYGSYDVQSGLDIRRLLGSSGRVFAWATSTDAEIDDALMRQIDLGVGTAEYLERIVARAARLGIRARIHLKIDTGLHRNGLLPEQWPGAIDRVRSMEAAGHLELVGVWSHLSEASDAEDDDAQVVFLEAVRVASGTGSEPPWVHLTASAASWWRSELRGSLSRIGAFCYGIRSAEGPALDGILPVAELIATVEEVGEESAIIGIGSFDGIPSSLTGAAVGTPAGPREILSIEPTTCALAGWPGMAVGDEVTIFGAGEQGESSATTLAERIDTVGEEILTRLTRHVRRVEVR